MKGEENLTLINRWLRHRNLSEWKDSDFPQYGYEAKKDGLEIAYGFLAICDDSSPGKGFIECLIVSPFFSKEVRDEALDKIIRALISLAKVFLLDGIVSFCELDATINRAIKHNFKVSKATTLVLDLREEKI